LSPNCEFEIEDSTIDQRILNIILTNNIDDETAQMTKTTFSIVINEEFNNFLSKLKLNHSKVVKHSKW
jgi:L-cystine uptake protein TcyP (sodium:dicarboxylate symporter family)